MKCAMVWCLAGCLGWLGATAGWADPPTEIDYQGKILVNDIPLTAEGYFKFAIADEAGTTNFWAHDGTATGEPGTWLTNDCYNGVFSTVLGAAPMDAIDEMVLALDTSLYLRVWFSSDAVTFDEMLPAQPLLSAPYAVNADLLDGYHADDIIALATNGFTEVDPVFGASAAAGIAAGDITDWDTAYGWGDHAAAGYATGTPVYAETDPVFGASAAAGISATDTQNWTTAYGWGDHAAAGYLTSETDPVWTAASNLYYQTADADARFVDVTGDTMTGVLVINDAASAALRIHSTNATVAIGNMATGGVMGVAVGDRANAASYGAALGYQANGTQNGVAIGYNATGATNGVAVGASADAQNNGVAVGATADGNTTGTAVGYQADGSSQGVAVGRDAAGFSYGAAVGPWAQGQWYGAALGRAADGATNGVAIGYSANGAYTNIAIGVAADAQLGTERIALGHNVTNTVDHSARIRGELYMDGGSALWSRPTFGTGAFSKLLPLPELENVVYVATNGTPAGPGTIDRPYNTPQNAYNAAAFKYAGEPAAVVIAAGTYPGLTMAAGHIHVLGESRAQLDSLMVSSAANSILGKQRVENLIVAGAATVAVDAGQDVKFHNCRFERGLMIYGPNVEVQDCFATGNDGPAVTVGNGASPIWQVAIYNSSLQNTDSANAALLVNVGVETLEVIGNKIANYDPDPMTGIRAWAAIEDQEISLQPALPPHLYAHNVIRGAETTYGTVPAVYDPMVGAGATTITFVHNAVWGDVGVNSNLQFYANNVVYGQINNSGGTVGWGQAGMGTGIDPAGNTEHQFVYPQFGAFIPGEGFPRAWQD